MWTKITSEIDKNIYFDKNIEPNEIVAGAYFNVKYQDGNVEFIYVARFDNWNEDGSAWYLEYPNQLQEYEFNIELFNNEEELKEYMEDMIVIGNKSYELVSWQTSPFLPEEFEIEFVTNDYKEATKYMITLKENGK